MYNVKIVEFFYAYIIDLKNQYFFLSIVIFTFFFIFLAVLSAPIIFFFTILAGYLFGIIPGLIIVLISLMMVYNIQTLFIQFFFGKITNLKSYQKYSNYLKKQKNPIMISIIRLIPLPYTIQNILVFELNYSMLKKNIFTFFGIIPLSLIIILLGNSLSHVSIDNIKKLQILNLDFIFYISIYVVFLYVLNIIFKKLFKN